ncbi:hypothetical protein D1604_12655 [Brevundimonas sp. LPMIX5]|uniref:hypothetical protein n=1 Tax=Brevundimonas sp. LPMIX5 TaxID=2305887 RepID=UPI000E664F17|nr:hypothetical protein [Brevundimonas sp. LPMIX5]RIJ65163.1 hypothetical protein D1604_12655 [Brevundimonas sp. LPMIX5]
MTPLERLGLEVAAFQLLGSRMKAATLCALLDAGGRTVTVEHLAEARPWMDRAITDTRNVIKTRICLLRETMDDVGLGGLVVTAGDRDRAGYAIPEPGRSAILARLVEVAA